MAKPASRNGMVAMDFYHSQDSMFGPMNRSVQLRSRIARVKKEWKNHEQKILANGPAFRNTCIAEYDRL
jgi:capsule polysaccharide export protein KpsE/RkpR